MPEGFKNYIELIKSIPEDHIKDILKDKLREVDKTRYIINFLKEELDRRSIK